MRWLDLSLCGHAERSEFCVSTTKICDPKSGGRDGYTRWKEVRKLSLDAPVLEVESGRRQSYCCREVTARDESLTLPSLDSLRASQNSRDCCVWFDRELIMDSDADTTIVGESSGPHLEPGQLSTHPYPVWNDRFSEEASSPW
jgi:hypothetical protein